MSRKLQQVLTRSKKTLRDNGKMLRDNKGAKKNQENEKGCWAIPKEHWAT
jgi:hypothetical protein